MFSELILYSLTTLLFSIPVPFLLYTRAYTTMRMVILLFAYDVLLTIEAIFFGDILAIGILHVITIPAFFVLIYLDLVRQNRVQFRCFICGRRIEPEDEDETIKRSVGGSHLTNLVHKACIELDWRDKKSISERSFRRGIPK